MILTPEDDFTISDTNIPAKPPELNQLAQRSVPEPTPVEVKPMPVVQPVDKHTPVDKPKAAETDDAKRTPASSSEPAQTKNATQSPDEKPATTSEAKDKSRAWVVQVASFTDRKKALALRDRLRKAKYPSFVESIAVKNTQLFRVRVGPVVSRDDADAWQKKIARDFKVKDALVMAHPG